LFTGLVADLGTVAEVHSTNDGVRLAIESPLARELTEGDSVAVNGVCLTAVGLCGDRFGAAVMHETLRRSSLAEVTTGTRVNLELALAADARLGGHFVQGHVDGLGRVRSLELDGEGARLRLELDQELLRYCVEKGSLTVDGVALTIAALDDTGVEIALVPFTLQETTLSALGPGDEVNVEVDLLAKYAERLATS
jgi:riboflavin synthase